MRRSLLFVVLNLLLSVWSVSAYALTASVVTCWPGSEIYELCGHSALRIRGEGIDSVWNYGVFDFNEPNFVGRFVAGKTDYMVMGYPFEWFMPEYQATNRKVVEQDLNLTQEEVAKLRKLLQTESLPANRLYRYNYVHNNCATRIIDRLEETTEGRIRLEEKGRYGTYRKEMRAYHHDYPWYQFGIDVALGSGIDHTIDSREEMFVPTEMHRMLRTARWKDGRPVVKEERVLFAGSENATDGPTVWWLTPFFWSVVLLAVTAVVAIADLRRKRLTRWYYTLLFFIAGLVGWLVTYLVFFSQHEATSPNILILWLNPLQWVVGVSIWWRCLSFLARYVSIVEATVILFMLLAWPWQSQSANTAFIPLMIVSVIAFGMCAYMPAVKETNDKNRVTAHKKTSGRRKRKK